MVIVPYFFDSISVVTFHDPVVIERKYVWPSTTQLSIIATSLHQHCPMVRVIEIQVYAFVVWVCIYPCLGSHKSVKPFKNLMLAFPIIIPCIFGPSRGYIEKRVRGKSFPKIIHKSESPRDTTSFLMVVEEISSYKPTEIIVSAC